MEKSRQHLQELLEQGSERVGRSVLLLRGVPTQGRSSPLLFSWVKMEVS